MGKLWEGLGGAVESQKFTFAHAEFEVLSRESWSCSSRNCCESNNNKSI